MHGADKTTEAVRPGSPGIVRVDRPVGRLPANAQKPRIRRLLRGGWLCDGGNLGGTGWTPAKAYRAWLWNMVHNASERRLIEFGLTR